MTVKFIKFIELFWIRSFNSEQKVLFPYGTSLLERDKRISTLCLRW